MAIAVRGARPATARDGRAFPSEMIKMNERSQPPWSKEVRAQARRCRRTVLTLRRHLIALCPDAPALARDRSLAERTNTTPYDHTAADALAGAEQLLAAIEDLLDT